MNTTVRVAGQKAAEKREGRGAWGEKWLAPLDLLDVCEHAFAHIQDITRELISL